MSRFTRCALCGDEDRCVQIMTSTGWKWACDICEADSPENFEDDDEDLHEDLGSLWDEDDA